MSSNVYTDGTLDLGSEPFKPEEKGETIEIKVSDVRPIKTKDGEKTGVVVEGIDKDGITRDWCAWNLSNKAELRREQPLPGDWLRITYDGRDPKAQNEALAARWFTLKKLDREATPKTGGEAGDDIPFMPTIDGAF